jgi:predicted ArsR family transcriptional regulator
MIFGSRLGDPVADRILEALRQRGELTETEICNLFSRHGGQENIQRAQLMLVGAHLVQVIPVPGTGGRPAKIWRLAKKAR